MVLTGRIVELKSGEWWFIHFRIGVRTEELFIFNLLNGMTAGPMIGKDINNDGTGEPEWSGRNLILENLLQ
jgi:hypothetical protein